MAQAESSTPEIPDNWLNDYTDYRQCFVCGSTNPGGLKLIYRQEGDEIVTEFVGSPQHQGFPGVVHGGLLSTILDETMGRTALFTRTWTMTGRLEIRFRNPAPVGERLTCRARLTRGRNSAFESRGEIKLDDGTLLAEGKGLFIRVPDEVREQAARHHPELGEYFNSMPDGKPLGRR
ncbi:MAG TPA: PaaI family thioesterase [Candidatus Solibacter sp.]|jgi:acyl-coenzyme A thioesterase PaaI-like protein|nr:PaaI family thioesterase [Candidatus Solibacter sp.]